MLVYQRATILSQQNAETISWDFRRPSRITGPSSGRWRRQKRWCLVRHFAAAKKVTGPDSKFFEAFKMSVETLKYREIPPCRPQNQEIPVTKPRFRLGSIGSRGWDLEPVYHWYLPRTNNPHCTRFCDGWNVAVRWSPWSDRRKTSQFFVEGHWKKRPSQEGWGIIQPDTVWGCMGYRFKKCWI